MFSLKKLADSYRDWMKGTALFLQMTVTIITVGRERGQGGWGLEGNGRDSNGLDWDICTARKDIGMALRSLSKDFSEEELADLIKARDILLEMKKIALRRNKRNTDLTLAHLGDLPTRFAAAIEDFTKTVPALTERALTKNVRDSGICLS